MTDNMRDYSLMLARHLELEAWKMPERPAARMREQAAALRAEPDAWRAEMNRGIASGMLAIVQAMPPETWRVTQ